ncbi:hypothetical protein [Rhizobium sp. WYCCWR 11152]|uniref:hypothetical protein n=1 Tax=Rhizobium sp. WYCCWR 11152 TaxID=2692316 RepID=UPI0032B1407B
MNKGNFAQEIVKVLANENTGLSNNDTTKPNRKKGMSDVCMAQGLLRDAFPPRRYGKVESAFYEAHKFISRRVRKQFTLRRVRSIWEGTARRIDSEEMEALKAALIEEHVREQRELRTRLASLDEKIAAFDAGMAGEALAEGRR